MFFCFYVDVPRLGNHSKRSVAHAIIAKQSGVK